MTIPTEEVCQWRSRAIYEIYLIPSARCLQKFFTCSSLPLFTPSSLPHSSPHQYPFTLLILHQLATTFLLSLCLLHPPFFPHSLLAPRSLFLAPFSQYSLFNCSSSRHICSPLFGLFILQPCIHEFPRSSRYISGSRQQVASSIFRGPLADLGTGKITSEAQEAAPSGLLASKSSTDH